MTKGTVLSCSIYKTSPRIENPLWEVWDKQGETFPDWANSFDLIVKLDKADIEISLACWEKPETLNPHVYVAHSNIFTPHCEEDMKNKLWMLYISHKRRILQPLGLW